MNTQTLDVRPGDTLIVSCQEAISATQDAEIKRFMMLKFPEVERVVVLPMGVSLSTARPGSTQELGEIRDMMREILELLKGGSYNGSIFVESV